MKKKQKPKGRQTSPDGLSFNQDPVKTSNEPGPTVMARLWAHCCFPSDREMERQITEDGRQEARKYSD